jgi:hypothetical protein
MSVAVVTHGIEKINFNFKNVSYYTWKNILILFCYFQFFCDLSNFKKIAVKLFWRKKYFYSSDIFFKKRRKGGKKI